MTPLQWRRAFLDPLAHLGRHRRKFCGRFFRAAGFKPSMPAPCGARCLRALALALDGRGGKLECRRGALMADLFDRKRRQKGEATKQLGRKWVFEKVGLVACHVVSLAPIRA